MPSAAGSEADRLVLHLNTDWGAPARTSRQAAKDMGAEMSTSRATMADEKTSARLVRCARRQADGLMLISYTPTRP